MPRAEKAFPETQAGQRGASLLYLGALLGCLLSGVVALLIQLFSGRLAALGVDPLTSTQFALAAAVLAGAVLGGFALNRHRAWLRLRKEERSFRDLYENISEGVFRSTLDGRMISANPSLVRLNGYETEKELIRYCNDIASEWYVDPKRRAEIHQMLLDKGRVTAVSEIYRHRTRERIWIEENVRLVRDKKTGEPLYYDGTLREVTETIRRLELQDRYNKIASIVSACLYQHRERPDGKGSMPYASVGLQHIFGVRPEEVAEDASILASRIHPDDLPHIHHSLKRSREELSVWQCEYRVMQPDGTARWVFAHSVPEREPDGSTLWHGYITDISERKHSEAKIYELAYFDPLTKLPNRTMLRDALQKALVGAAYGRQGAVLFVDLDNFKMLNDTKGHHVGDLLLCETASRVRACVRPDDLVARLGGDEFVVVLDNLGSDPRQAASRAQAVGESILSAIDRPFLLDDHQFQTTASIGIALFRDAGADVDEILKRADLAMYEAKSGGRATLRFFQDAMQVAVDERAALTSDLRQAHIEGKLALEYQPQVDRSGRWIGAEALLRWDHPTRGAVSPAEFIPLAERSGFMPSVERWVLQTASRTLKQWEKDRLTSDLKLAVNISAQQLIRKDFRTSLHAILAEAGANPRRLTLEITEHVMLDNFDEVSEVMLSLKEIGVSFAIDDFGTGYSSLSYLKRLPIDTLKVDQSFVRDIHTDASDREIVQTILNIARSLRVSVVAEGVETEMQSLLLRQMGCEVFQGFLFARPMRQDVLLQRLAQQGQPSEKRTAERRRAAT